MSEFYIRNICNIKKRCFLPGCGKLANYELAYKNNALPICDDCLKALKLCFKNKPINLRSNDKDAI